jgi:hypothetical protein
MMKTRTRAPLQAAVEVGFAVAPTGDGVAYLAPRARRPSQGGGALAAPVRLTFRCVPLPGLRGRDVAYAAVSAAVEHLIARGVGAAEIAISDGTLVADLRERRSVPPGLAMPYVALRCKLNRLAHASVVIADGSGIAELSARAAAEAALHVAA